MNTCRKRTFFPKSRAVPLKDPPVYLRVLQISIKKGKKKKSQVPRQAFASVGADCWLKCDTTPTAFSVLRRAGSFTRPEVLCPIQQCSHETIARETKTCTPVTCCVQCFLGSHYFWINLCWWQFHCQLLWWYYYYGAFILLLFLCSQLFFCFCFFFISLS